MKRLLIINPGSTSTKFAVFDDAKEIFSRQIAHDPATLFALGSLYDQVPYRKTIILDALEKEGIALASITATVGRGGPLHPLPGGVFRINQAMIDDLTSCRYGEHASAIGSFIAYELGLQLGVEALTADPVVVDEMDDIARISGWPKIERISIFHALNQKAVARRYALSQTKKYEDINLIVAHMGGGVSVAAHRKGKVIDVANGLDGDGPFSAERSGGLPTGALVKLCLSGSYHSADELWHELIGKGGLYAYLGTKDGREVRKRIEAGDKHARLIYEALAYQVSKEIASLSAVLYGDVDAILLTGGLAHDEMLTDWIKARVSHLAKVIVFAGEDEAEALAESAYSALEGRITIQEYKP